MTPAPSDFSAKLRRQVTRRVYVKPAPIRLDRTVASITFDDFPQSAWTRGGAMLKARGWRGTYYAVGGFEDGLEEGQACYRAGDLAAIAAEGHEIGCHSFSHQRAADQTSVDLEADLDRNKAFFHDRIPDREVTSFAFPYGEASVSSKALIGQRFACARGIYWGVNHGVADLSQLRAAGLERNKWRPEAIEKLIEAAVKTKGWVIFFTHDVGDDPTPYGATPDMLDHLFDTLERFNVEVLPVKHALAKAVFGS